MAKTTKGDVMERRAEKWIMTSYGLDDCGVKSLTRLLRKVAREAEKREMERCVNEIQEWRYSRRLGTIDSVIHAIRNRRSA